MIFQESGYEPYRLPYWIRATFIMEERWGELEAEFNAAKDAVQLAEEWGVVSPLCALRDSLLPAEAACCPRLPSAPLLLPLPTQQTIERWGVQQAHVPHKQQYEAASGMLCASPSSATSCCCQSVPECIF